MSYSAGTHSPPPDGPIRLFVHRVGNDHPKACTGRWLLDRRLATPPPRSSPRGARPILLDPYAKTPVSRADTEAARRGGLLAIDCSWNQLSRTGHFAGEEGPAPPGGIHRRLPWLLAANPQHYGQLSELNTAEALGAALYLLGEGERAAALLAGFPGGRGFFEINADAFRAYLPAEDGPQLLEAERARFR
jgi:rRNA small subunit aminocarboxypropyltransferase